NLARVYPATNRDITAAVAPLRDRFVFRVRASLLVLLGAVGLVLLIACVNVGNLLIVRALGERREVAIRMAIGATPAQVAIELAVRGLVLGMLGGIAGLVLGVWVRALVVSIAPIDTPGLDDIGLNLRVLAATTGLSLLTGALAGLLPVLQLRHG